MIVLRVLAGILAALIVIAAGITIWRKADDDVRFAIKTMACCLAGVAGFAVLACLIQFAATGSLT